MLRLVLLLGSFTARFLKDSHLSHSPVFCSSEKLLMVLLHSPSKICLNSCLVLKGNVHSISQQGHLFSCRIHECMLNAAIKGHFLSSSKLTAPLSISTPCAWEIKTYDCLFFS